MQTACLNNHNNVPKTGSNCSKKSCQNEKFHQRYICCDACQHAYWHQTRVPQQTTATFSGHFDPLPASLAHPDRLHVPGCPRFCKWKAPLGSKCAWRLFLKTGGTFFSTHTYTSVLIQWIGPFVVMLWNQSFSFGFTVLRSSGCRP